VLGRMAISRKIDHVALGWLIVVSVAAIAAFVWVLTSSSSYPGSVSCGFGGVLPPGCSSSLGDKLTLICVVAVPLVGLLSYKAFFTKVGRGK
ncbi:hypothetical protein, partial [Luteimonas padinae]